MPVNIIYFYKPDNVTSTVKSVSQLDQIKISICGVIKYSGKEDYNIRVYITENTSEQHIADILGMSTANCNISCAKIIPPRPIGDSRQEIISAKLYILDAAKEEFDKFLFLDNDTVVLDDVSKVFHSDLYDYPIGGCTDMTFYDSPTHTFYNRVFRRPGRDYIQGGLYLVNGKMLRDEGFSFTSLFNDAIHTPGGEEPAINKALDHRKRLLPIEWNVTPHTCIVLGEQQVETAKILHFAGAKNFVDRDFVKMFPKFQKAVLDAGYKDAINFKMFLGRMADGLGDAIMFGDVIKLLEDKYPYVKIDVSAGPTTMNVLKATGCNVRFVSRDANASDYAVYISHVVYPAPSNNRGTHMLIGMLQQVFSFVPFFSLESVEEVRLCSCEEESHFPTPEDYIVVPSLEGPKKLSEDKYYNRWADLVSLLSRQYNVYELNTSDGTKTFTKTKGVFATTSLADTAKILKNARFSVTMENGLNHWACHNGGKTYCLMISPRVTPGELYYSTMTPVMSTNNESPEKIVSFINDKEGK